jgi:hypothetical protein
MLCFHGNVLNGHVKRVRDRTERFRFVFGSTDGYEV